MDFLRWIYYNIMTRTGFADTYRYEQYISRPDWLYQLEALFISINLNSNDKKKVANDVGFIFLLYFSLLTEIIPTPLGN